MLDDPKFTPMTDAVTAFEKRLESQHENDFVETGFRAHDRTIGRLRRGELTLIGGRPGMGKTAITLVMALNQLELGLHVYFFSLEMSIEIVMARLVSIKTKIPLLRVIERRLNESEVQRIIGVLPSISMGIGLPSQFYPESKPFSRRSDQGVGALSI